MLGYLFKNVFSVTKLNIMRQSSRDIGRKF